MKFHLTHNPTPTSAEDLFIGQIEFSPDERKGVLPACIKVTGAPCQDPACSCGEVCLTLPPLDPGALVPLEEDEPPVPRFFVLCPEFCEASADFSDLDEPILMAVARQIPLLLTGEHWENVSQLYRETRTRLAESCDIAKFDQIPEYLRGISLNPGAKDVEASLRDLFDFPLDSGLIDDTAWYFEEFYPVPNTPSPLAVTVEFRITEDGLEPNLTEDQYMEVSDDPDGFPEYSCPTLKIRWNLDSGEVTELTRIKTDLPIHRFLDLLLQVYPDARERFRRRHQHLVESIARIPAWIEANPGMLDDEDFDTDWSSTEDEGSPYPLARTEPSPLPQPTVRPTPKVGRNDPCPCGSGKKFKKCCGG
jgi:hypothetical protein